MSGLAVYHGQQYLMREAWNTWDGYHEGNMSRSGDRIEL
jgi:hypothetical protein